MGCTSVDASTPRMIFVHAADIHLGSQLAALDRSETLPAHLVRAAPLAAFRRIADLCVERDAEVLLIAGDLFDTNAPLSVVLDATDVLKRIAARTHVVMIRGNHDAHSKISRELPHIDNVHLLPSDTPGTVILELAGGRVAVHGRGFDTPTVTENIVRAYPSAVPDAFNVGLLHTSLEGNATHATYAPCSVDDLVALGYDYWALGHIHQHDVVRDHAPTIVYAGSPQGRHVNEAGEHGAYVVRVDGVELVGPPEHVELASIQWHHVTIEVAESDDDADAHGLVARVRAELEALAASAPHVRHIVRVTVAGRCSAHVEIARDPAGFAEQLHLTAGAVGSADVHVERVRVRTLPLLPDPAVLHERLDAIGAFALHLDSDLLDEDWSDTLAVRGLPPALLKVNERLQKLGSDGHVFVTQEIDPAVVADARDELLGVLVAHSEVVGEKGLRR